MPWKIGSLPGYVIEVSIFVDVPYRECAMNLGVNLVGLGNDRILSMASDSDLNERLRALGFKVHEPDMSMFTLGGGGVHCLSQALCREPILS